MRDIAAHGLCWRCYSATRRRRVQGNDRLDGNREQGPMPRGRVTSAAPPQPHGSEEAEFVRQLSGVPSWIPAELEPPVDTRRSARVRWRLLLGDWLWDEE